jgi:hypothetical protein
MGIRFALLKAIINCNRCNTVALCGDREAGHRFQESVSTSGRLLCLSLQGASGSITQTKCESAENGRAQASLLFADLHQRLQKTCTHHLVSTVRQRDSLSNPPKETT